MDTLNFPQITSKIVKWIKEEVKESQSEGLVFGLSGGIDSSIVAVICQKAMKNNVLGLVMPCHSLKEDRDHAMLVINKFNIPFKEITLDHILDIIKKAFPLFNEKIAENNLKPRLRMLTLYYFANGFNYLVAGTGNKSEIQTGYFTKYGDGGADILPLAGLYKTQIKEFARTLDIPEEIIEKPPSAGLWEGQTDEGELGLSYEELDNILFAMETGTSSHLPPEKIEKVKSLIKNSEHKRNPIPKFIL
ncbi:MAG: NAD+ synthase [Thermodesulfobacteriota bacterium]|nr:NAD+ synthase [Thermodesulfobacteriota bacterium]